MDTVTEQRANKNTGQTVMIAIVSLVIGFILGMTLTKTSENESLLGTDADNNNELQDENTTIETKNDSDTATVSSTSDANSDRSFDIAVSSLPQAQQTMLKTMGMNDQNINITNSMVACAEQKFGAQRVSEFKTGASPSVSEGVGLMACYTAN